MNPPALAEVLIIGCGNIAGGFDATRPDGAPPLTHAGAYTRHGGFRIAACVEPDAARREAFMARWGVPHGAPSVQDLGAAAGGFDIVSICSPTPLHEAHLDAALALRPRLIFCEKPVTPTVESTERAVARCAEAGVVLAVNHTRRWAPDVVRLAAELKAGASGPWGEVRAASGTYNKGVLNNGAHLVDLLHLLLGPLQVVAAGAPRADHFADDPSVPALLRGAQGVPVVLNVADARDYALFELQLATSRACITMEDGGLHWRVRHAVESADFKGYRTLDAGQVRDGEYFAAMSEAVADLHAALAGGRAPRSTGASALQAQRVCEALRLAAAGGAGPAGGAAAATIAGPRVE